MSPEPWEGPRGEQPNWNGPDRGEGVQDKQGTGEVEGVVGWESPVFFPKKLNQGSRRNRKEEGQVVRDTCQGILAFPQGTLPAL